MDEQISGSLIAVVGLGYVGLPLAAAFGCRRSVVGFDIDEIRVQELSEGIDRTLECSNGEIASAKHLKFSSNPQDLALAQYYIITVPTPIDKSKRPDLSPLISASSMVGAFLKPGDVVIYESTVYPGATEEICVPILEKQSNLTCIFNDTNHISSHTNKSETGFYVGYSPERINPGDKLHRLTNIVKVTSGSTPAIARKIDSLYGEVVEAGTFLASSIKVAEAAKVIENTQRDINIALINELSLIFNKLGIDTLDVLEAAGSKWNFLPFRPGLVGGHCIGVDPYYLVHKAHEIDFNPQIISAGRQINDAMPQHVVDCFLKDLVSSGHDVSCARILILGFSFKENCPDFRNTKILEVVRLLESYNLIVDIQDSWVDSAKASQEHGLNIITNFHDLELGTYSGIIVACAHQEYIEKATQIPKLGIESCIIHDLKHIIDRDEVDRRL